MTAHRHPLPNGAAVESEPAADGSAGHAAPASVEQALARAQAHARTAAAEGLAAARALLDAAALATRGSSADTHPVLGPIASLLEGLESQLARRGAIASSRLLEALADALDGEIARWEERAREETEARAVLRAFLGLREVLWELGVRRGAQGGPSRRAAGRPRAAGVRGRRASRVEHIPVQE